MKMNEDRRTPYTSICLVSFSLSIPSLHTCPSLCLFLLHLSCVADPILHRNVDVLYVQNLTDAHMHERRKEERRETREREKEGREKREEGGNEKGKEYLIMIHLDLVTVSSPQTTQSRG